MIAIVMSQMAGVTFTENSKGWAYGHDAKVSSAPMLVGTGGPGSDVGSVLTSRPRAGVLPLLE
ncbi:hypothetical protein GCM10027058_20310 [Microbacterium neimengense]